MLTMTLAASQNFNQSLQIRDPFLARAELCNVHDLPTGFLEPLRVRLLPMFHACQVGESASAPPVEDGRDDMDNEELRSVALGHVCSDFRRLDRLLRSVNSDHNGREGHSGYCSSGY